MAASTITDSDLDAFLADERFTQIFERPARSPDEKALRISYADYGYRNEERPEEENVLLFCGPLVGSRMMHVAKDSMAKAHNVRIINADRPGFGKTPDVEPTKRLAHWREAILALLQHLQIRHVSLATQSAGAVYALDLVLHHPEILHPEERGGYLAMGAPWIHPSHSGVWHLSVAEALPTSVLAHFNKVAEYFTVVSAPLISRSIDLVGSARNWLTAPSQQQQQQQQQQDPADPEIAFAEALDRKLGDCIFGNSAVGMSNDAIMLLQRPNDDQHLSGWADWGDYDALVPRLRQALADSGRRLVVDVFFAESDAMIGNPGAAGPEWFKSCWQATGPDDRIAFSSRVVAGADHDSIWAARWGLARDVLGRLEGFASSAQ